jgi:putative copper resistance protein D
MEERQIGNGKIIHIISGSLHILAVVTWVGSMIYNQFAVAPSLDESLGSVKTHAVGGLIMKKFGVYRIYFRDLVYTG